MRNRFTAGLGQLQGGRGERWRLARRL